MFVCVCMCVCVAVNVAYMLIDALQLRRSSESVTTSSTTSLKAYKARLTLCKMMKVCVYVCVRVLVYMCVWELIWV